MNLKRINERFILKTEYITRNKLNLHIATTIAYPDYKIFSKLKNDKTLLCFFEDFEHYCCVLNNLYDELFLSCYKEYYDRVIQHDEELGYPSIDTYNIFRSYNDKRKHNLRVQIHRINELFKTNGCTAQKNGHDSKITYLTWIDETIKIHDKIIDYCINHLKL